MAISTNLLDLDPDKLLVEESVEGVEGIARRLQREVDSKREELRVMVGERYRELIEAADTIQQMKLSSLAVIDSVSGMQNSCMNLRKHSFHISSAKQPGGSGPAGVNLPYLSVTASLQFLMAVPERIWATIDSDKLMQGAQLYLLATHVHTGLQGDQGGGMTPERTKFLFPLISRQIATINNFYQGISNSAREQLLVVDLKKEEAVDALAALVLLKGWNCREVMVEFLKTRLECLTASRVKGRSESARVSICTYIRGLLSTVDCLAGLFGDGSSNLAEHILASTGDQAPCSINIIGKASLGGMEKYLPEPVLNFKPRLAKHFNQISQADMVSEVDGWLDEVVRGGTDECSRLLKDISSLQGVAGARQAVWNLLLQYPAYVEWDTNIKAVSGKSLDIWQTIYREPLRDKSMNLISASLSCDIDALEKRFEEECDECGMEDKLGAYIWSETGSDLSFLWSRAEGQAGLTLKCRGWSQSVHGLCSQFDAKLSAQWTDIRNFNEGEGEDTGPFDRFSDATSVSDQFVSVLASRLTSMVSRLEQAVQAEDSRSRVHLTLFLARFLQALPVLTRTLSVAGQPNATGGIVEYLNEKSVSIFSIWMESVVEGYRVGMRALNQLNPLALLPAWDTVTIQESGESGEVTSVIKVPALPSLPFSHLLNQAAVLVHRAHPASIPRSNLATLAANILQISLDTMQELSNGKLTQQLALQLLFNTRFIETLFLDKDLKEKYGPKAADLTEKIQSNIDPFDLSVFSVHLESRVKRSCARALNCLAPLIPADRFQILAAYKPSAAPQDASNIMSVKGDPTSRFQLLPLATTTRYEHSSRSKSSVQLSLDVKKPAAARKRDRSPVAATAASFFGSMGSSWFGAGNS